MSATDTREVQRARRLPAAEQRHRPGQIAVKPGDIASPVQMTRRDEHEDHHQIGEALQQIVRPRIAGARAGQPQVFRDRAAHGGPPQIGGRPARGSGGSGRCAARQGR